VLLESIAVVFLMMPSGSLSFELPAELRSHISRFVFLPDITSSWPFHNRTSLLFVYRQIHNEVLRFLYKGTLFLASSSVFQDCFKVHLSSSNGESGEKCPHGSGNAVKSPPRRGSKVSRLWMGGSQVLRRPSTIRLVAGSGWRLNWNLWLTMC